MGAVTPTVPASGRERAKPLLGMRLERYNFASLTSGDTWTVPGGTARINSFAFFGGANSITQRWVKTNATTMTFTSSASPMSNGILLLYCKGGG